MNLKNIEHRPWKLPERDWTVHMEWHDLLFLHWPVPSKILRPLIPPQLEIDCWEGNAWLGIVPFTMSGVYSKGRIPFSNKRRFCELNVRTYVSAKGKPGVWFFSLDTESISTVLGARWNFSLPYYFAKMSARPEGDSIAYTSRRLAKQPSLFSAKYRPTAPTQTAKPGTIEHWLAERYRLYTKSLSGQVCFADIHHAQWPLQEAECDIYENKMQGTVKGLGSLGGKPLAHYAKYLEVVAWPLERLATFL